MMGKYKFRLSELIPNAWFYKLKDMSRTKNRTKNTHQTPPPPSSYSQSSSSAADIVVNQSKTNYNQTQRKSYYFTRDLDLDSSTKAQTTEPTFHKTPHQEPPRKSSRKRRSIKKNRVNFNRTPLSSSPRLVTATVSAGCNCEATIESVWNKPDSTSEEYPDSPDITSSSEHESLLPELGSDRDDFIEPVNFRGSCHSRKMQNDSSPDAKFIVSDQNKLNEFDPGNELGLAPIVTKPKNRVKNRAENKAENRSENREPNETTTTTTKIQRTSLSVKVIKENIINSSISLSPTKEHKRNHPVRRFSSSGHSPGLKLRTNSPRLIGNRRIQQARKSISSTSNSSSGSRKSTVSDSYAVVKCSKDPHRDFRESMVEMIVQNNIRATKDLEELLACYLSWNSDEYHDLIINVFKQIWFDIIDLH